MKFKTIGSDPEFFVYDPKGKPYPATLFAKGTKENPVPIEIDGTLSGFFEQRDNLSFEGNVPPAKNKEDFIYNITFLRDYFQKKVAKFGYSLSPNGVEYFDKRYRDTPEGLEFGCSTVISTWDSYWGYFSNRPTPVLTYKKFRVSGFHIHIGYRGIGVTVYDDILIGRLFDLFLTMPSQRIKPEPERIRSYGQYGIIRSKPYGVECRTLSTYFTQKEYLPWVWDQLMLLEDFINSCSENDLTLITKHSHIIGLDERRLKKVFAGLFHEFENKDVLTKFKETNEIFTDKGLKPREVVKAKPVPKEEVIVDDVEYEYDYRYTFDIPPESFSTSTW